MKPDGVSDKTNGFPTLVGGYKKRPISPLTAYFTEKRAVEGDFI